MSLGGESLVTRPRFASLRRSILGNIGLVYLVSMVDLSVSVLSNLVLPLVATRMEFAHYRLLILYGGYAGFLHFGLLNGFYLAIIGLDPQRVDRGLRLVVRRALLVQQALLLPVSIFALATFLPVPSLGLILSVPLLWLLNNLLTFHNYLYQGTQSFRIFARINLIGKALAAGLLVLFVLTGWTTTMALSLAALAAPLIVVVLYESYWWHLRMASGVNLGKAADIWRSIASTWRKGLPLYAANFFLSLMFTVDNLVVSFRFDSEKFAAYAFAFGLTSILYLIFDGMTVAITPRLAHLRSQLAGESADIHTLYWLLIWLMPLTYWLSVPIVRAVYPNFTDSLPMLLWFVAALPFSTLIRSRIVALANASGQAALLLSIAGPCFLLTSVAVSLAAMFFQSLVGVAASWAAAVAVSAGIGVLMVHRRVPVRSSASNRWLLINAITSSGLFLISSAGLAWIQGLSLYVSAGMMLGLLLRRLHYAKI